MSHAIGATASYQRRKSHTPFHAHKDGVSATGTVHEVRRNEDGKTHQVTIRHEAPNKATERKGAMDFDSYNHETKATMPASEAKKFRTGQAVHVTITPAQDGDADEDQVPVTSHTRSRPKGSIRRHPR